LQGEFYMRSVARQLGGNMTTKMDGYVGGKASIELSTSRFQKTLMTASIAASTIKYTLAV
jgi:hypothetical protein